jgi:hypothetical protein
MAADWLVNAMKEGLYPGGPLAAAVLCVIRGVKPAQRIRTLEQLMKAHSDIIYLYICLPSQP